MAHALPPADRAWLLDALPADDRRALQGMLAELAALGIPPDAALLEGLEAQPLAGVSSAGILDSLGKAQVRQLARLLQDEPPLLTARLLAVRSWRWNDALLAAMAPHFALQVRQAPRRARAPALDAALCEGLARRLAALPAERSVLAARLRREAGRLLRSVGAGR